MTSRGVQRIRRFAAVLMLASQATLSAGADQLADGPDASSTHHYAIVGAVPVPATYSSDQAEVALRDVVLRAGGFTDDASGGIRIIHGGRQQEQVFCSAGELPDSAVRVPSGSIIAVESSRADAPQKGEYLYIACAGLVNRPAVLGGNAPITLSGVVAALEQSPRLADSVLVLPRKPQSGSTALPVGTVLIFDPTAIDRAKLQRVLRSYPLTDLFPLETEEAPPTDEIAEVRPRERLESPAETAVAPEPPAEPVEGPLMAAPAPVPVIEQARPVSRLTTVSSDAATSLFRESPTIASVQAQQAAELPAAAPDSGRKPALGTASQPVPPPPSPDDKPTAAPRRPESRLGSHVLYAATMAAGLALLAMLGAILWSRRERRYLRDRQEEAGEQLARTGRHTPVSERHVLDLLINDELPVVVEEVVLPEGTEFHGRAVGFRYLVRHEPQSLRGPHFPSTARPGHAAGTEHSSRAGQQEDGTSPPTPVVQATRTRQTASATVSPLERALRAQQRETSR